MMNRPAKQKGAALIMAMMVVALVVSIAVEMSWRFDLSSARTANRWAVSQAGNYTEGISSIAMELLEQDFKDDQAAGALADLKDVDEPLGMDFPSFMIGEAGVEAKFSDAQSKFNLNLLAENVYKLSNVNPYDNYTVHQKRFIRLLQTINVSDDPNTPIYLEVYEAQAITEAIIDWMDDVKPYDTTTGSGQEADYYLALDPPVAISNQEMIDVSELRLVYGMTPKLYQELLNYVTVLKPVGQASTAVAADMKMNLNTIHSNMFRMFNTSQNLMPLDPMDAKELEGVIRDPNGDWVGIERVEDFTNAKITTDLFDSLSSGPKDKFDSSGLSVYSEFFILSTIINFGGQQYPEQVLIYRNSSDGKTQVVGRTKTGF